MIATKGDTVMPRGASGKREREYEELKGKFKKSGRYKGREEEVAARIVNKQRAEHGETKAAKSKETKGKSSARNLPIEGYDKLTVKEATKRLKSLSESDVKKIRSYEQGHKGRKSLLQQINRNLKGR